MSSCKLSAAQSASNGAPVSPFAGEHSRNTQTGGLARRQRGKQASWNNTSEASFMTQSGSKQNKQLNIWLLHTKRVCDMQLLCLLTWIRLETLVKNSLGQNVQICRSAYSGQNKASCHPMLVTFTFTSPLAWLRDGRGVQSDACFSVSEVKCASTSRLLPFASFASIRINPLFACPVFQEEVTDLARCQALITALGFSSLWHAQNLARRRAWLANEA